jgi:prepilin peptidase CpaA
MVICTLAAILDAYTRRIPNHLTYTAILAGLAINALASACTHIDTPHFTTAAHWLAAPGITQSLLGFGVCAALGLFGVIARIGGGDIKLLAALGALMGLANIGAVLIVALSAALVYALLNLALSGRLNTFIQLLALRALELLYFRRFDPFPDSPEMPQAKRHDMIPMAVPLALGLIVAQLLDMKSRLGIGS